MVIQFFRFNSSFPLAFPLELSRLKLEPSERREREREREPLNSLICQQLDSNESRQLTCPTSRLTLKTKAALKDLPGVDG